MSESITDLNLREQIVRIDRAIAETHKLQNETEKFVAEQRKLTNESEKFFAEARKMQRDYSLSPFLAVAATVTSLGGLAAITSLLMRLLEGK